MTYLRRLLLVLVAALASASAAAADVAPTITLLSPPNGASVILDGRHNPTLSWQLQFPQPQATTTQIQLTVSADPNFLGSVYSETRICAATTPACFTSTTPQGTYWIDAATGSTTPPAKPVTLYWRVSLNWQTGQPAVNSATGSFSGIPNPNDRTPPHVSVKAATVKRGGRARVRFQLADESGIVTANARLLYRGTTLFSTSRTFSDVSWANLYVFWFDVPRYAKRGRYSACVRATDAHGNTAQSCARLTIR
jgi:hypothetical protein